MRRCRVSAEPVETPPTCPPSVIHPAVSAARPRGGSVRALLRRYGPLLSSTCSRKDGRIASQGNARTVTPADAPEPLDVRRRVGLRARHQSVDVLDLVKHPLN